MPFLTSLPWAFAFLFVVPVVIGYWTRHLKIAVPVAVLATAAAVTGTWISIGETVPLESVVSVDEDTLMVTYVGGECEDHRSVSVVERTPSVSISITTRSFASGCSDVGMLYRVSIELAQPLGSREIVDAGCTEDRVGCQRILEPEPAPGS